MKSTLPAQIASLEVLNWLISESRCSRQFHIAKYTFLPFRRKSRPEALNSTRDRPSIDNPECISSRNACSINETGRNCQSSRSLRKSQFLERHKNLMKAFNYDGLSSKSGLCRQQSENGMLPLLGFRHVKTHISRSN
jgi:hypothetical protein